jgi:subtilisin family serine protease
MVILAYKGDLKRMDVEKSKIKTETEFFYTNKFSDKHINFSPKTDEVMATFSPQPEDAASEIIGTLPLPVSQGINFQKGVAALKVTSGLDLLSTENSLSEHPQIINTIPVMVDNEGLTRYLVPDEFTVQFQEEISKEQAEKIIEKEGCKVITEHRTGGYYTLTVPEGMGMFEIIRRFSDLPEVAFAEPCEIGFNNMAVHFPDNSDFNNLWHLHNIGQIIEGQIGTIDADMDVVEAWDKTRGKSEVIIAVIDTGIDLEHINLKPNILPRGDEDWDFADSEDPVPKDFVGHGTKVAGTAAGIESASGVIGVAPQCRILPLRVNLTSGSNESRADAINYITEQAITFPHRRYIINCSWIMNGDHAGVCNAIIKAVNNNVLVIFAAGNDERNIDEIPAYPAVYPEVIAVAATDQSDRKYDFSNYGEKIDVSAPGVNIYTSFLNNKHTFGNGTSMAAPNVAGLAALIWSHNPALTNHEVRQIIENTCDNIDEKNPGFTGKLGKGRVNAFNALSTTHPAS